MAVCDVIFVRSGMGGMRRLQWNAGLHYLGGLAQGDPDRAVLDAHAEHLSSFGDLNAV